MDSPAPPAEPAAQSIRSILPGVGLASLIAVAATGIGLFLPVLGSAVAALAIGASVALARKPGPRLGPGVAFASKTVLQIAVVLLGARLSLGEVAAVGLDSLPVMLTTLVVCLAAAYFIGRALGVDRDLRTLIGVGTGICGASAIAAVAPIIKASTSAIGYAVATIFVFNIAAVFTFPLIGHVAGLDQRSFGLFVGTAVNDTSSVVATASSYGSAALGFAIVVKLVRTLMIVPISMGLAVMTMRRERLDPHRAEPRSLGTQALHMIPWFLVGFLAMSLLRTLGLFPDSVIDGTQAVAQFFIAVAMAGIGLSADRQAFHAAGPRPLVLGAILWILVTITALAMISLTQ